MKKTIMTALLALALVAGINTSFAAGIGYVDYAKVSTSYPLAKQYTQELDKKVAAIKAYAEAQDKKILAAKTDAEKRAIRNESVKLVRAKQQDYATTRNKYENILTQKVVAAAEKVRVAKKLDIIIKKDSRVTGGVDCTLDVLNALK